MAGRRQDPRALVLATLLAAIVPCGCGPPSPAELLRDWDLGVAEAAGSAAEPRTPSVSPRLPDRRARLLEVSDLRVGWLDFFSIQGCRWGALVSQRNSPLGKVMPLTRRLVYELEFVAAADACLEGLSAARRPRFEAALATKRRELGRHVWNAVWAGPEIERFLSASPGPVLGRGVSAEQALDGVAAALAAALASPADGEALATTLAELRRAPGAGPLLRDLARAGATLESVADRLERFDPEGCSLRSQWLVRLFEERYVRLVQPLVAGLDRDAQPLLASLAVIYERTRRHSDERVPALERYYARVLGDDADALGPRFRSASVRHARAWAPVLAACGRLPGSPGPE